MVLLVPFISFLFAYFDWHFTFTEEKIRKIYVGLFCSLFLALYGCFVLVSWGLHWQ